MNPKPIIYGQNVVIGQGVIFGHGVISYDHVIINDYVQIHDYSIIGQLPFNSNLLTRHSRVSTSLEIGKSCIIGSHVILYAGVKIGTDTLIADYVAVRENSVIGNQCILGTAVCINLNTVVKNRVKIMNQTHIVADSLIEDDVFISLMVCTTNDNHMGRSPYQMKGIHIKTGASIGAGATFLPAVTVGQNAVVGAGSLVIHDVPDNQLVMGNPARIVKRTPPKLSSRINHD